MTAGPRVVLCGPTGVGKSTVGALLAERLRVSYRDTDQDLAAREGRPVADIFVHDGEDYLRDAEARAVAAALTEHDGVLALGGGAVLPARTRQRLAGLPVVFLSMSAEEAARRLPPHHQRPLLGADPQHRWRQLMDARRPLYLSVARVVIDTDAREPDQVVEDILHALVPRSR